jgi:hypothetical protein
VVVTDRLTAPPGITFLGHSTVLIEVGGLRILTDPVLFDRVGLLRRVGSPLDPGLHLAGFGEWNNRYGMAAGDEVLVFLAEQLRAIPDSVAMRDGGDEFVVIGSPTGAALSDRLTEFRRRLPERFLERFGPEASPVAARIVTLTVEGRDLVAGRDQLGRDIARLKMREPHPVQDGVQVSSTELSH